MDVSPPPRATGDRARGGKTRTSTGRRRRRGQRTSPRTWGRWQGADAREATDFGGRVPSTHGSAVNLPMVFLISGTGGWISGVHCVHRKHMESKPESIDGVSQARRAARSAAQVSCPQHQHFIHVRAGRIFRPPSATRANSSPSARSCRAAVRPLQHRYAMLDAETDRARRDIKAGAGQLGQSRIVDADTFFDEWDAEPGALETASQPRTA